MNEVRKHTGDESLSGMHVSLDHDWVRAEVASGKSCEEVGQLIKEEYLHLAKLVAEGKGTPVRFNDSYNDERNCSCEKGKLRIPCSCERG